MPVSINYAIPTDLHRAAKVAAAAEGITLREFIIRALEQAVAKPKRGRR